MRRLGVLTGGGDCPGLNAAIRAVVRACEQHGIECLGFPAGWRGVIDNEARVLDRGSLRGQLDRGGTILGTSRVDPYRSEDGVARIRQTLTERRLDGIVCIGGEGTLSAARRLHNDGIPLVGVPKTIDNDVHATELTIGFSTAVEIATEAVDRLHSTAESHNRIMVLETMGRHVGWIAVQAGMAGGADSILIPEQPFDIEQVAERMRRRFARPGCRASIVVVAEGAHPVPGTMPEPRHPLDEFGRPRLGGIGAIVARELEARTGVETRVTQLGYVQRGGTPCPADRVLATRFGIRAVELARQRRLGTMTALVAGDIVAVPLADAVGTLKQVPEQLYRDAAVFFE